MPGSAPLRIVIVTLDNHLSGAVERAEARLVAEGTPITIGFHAAADWDHDPGKLDRCLADIARGDIVIATMLFLDDHIRAVQPALEARRERCVAMVGLMSGAEIVRLTKLGGYRMDAPAKGPLALLKRLRGKGGAGASGAGQMKMLRRLPKMLRFIPGTAQDVRAYFLTLQYWLAGSDDNVVAMIRALAHRYAGHEQRADPPRDYPEVGLYHPGLRGRIDERLAVLPAPKRPAGTVGVLMLRSYLLARDAGHYDGVIAALEARGLRVIPAFASGLDSRPAIDRYFVKDGRATVDAVVSLTGFSLVGGPAYNDAKAAEAILAKLDVPFVAAHPIEFQSLQQWGASRQGLLPLEATMMVAIPELDGATLPSVFGGRADGSGEACTGCGRRCEFPTAGLAREMRSCPERAEALAAKVARLVALKRSERARIAAAMVAPSVRGRTEMSTKAPLIPAAPIALAAISASAAALARPPSRPTLARPSVSTTTNGVRPRALASSASARAAASPAASGVPPPPGSSARHLRALASDRVGGSSVSAAVPRNAIRATCDHLT